jgi:hypothetical protein
MRAFQRPIFCLFNLLLGIFCWIGSTHLLGQTVILERDIIAQDTVVDEYGKNKKHFIHGLVGLGFIIGPSSPGIPMQYGNSMYFHFGGTYKHKIDNHRSLGTDLLLQFAWYRLKQDSSKRFPNTTLNRRERYSIPVLTWNLFGRWNFDKVRGDNLGRYVDVGIGSNLVYRATHQTKNPDPITGGNIEILREELDYIAPFYWTAFTRVGYYGIQLYLCYRITPVFRPQRVQRIYGQRMDLADWSIGLQVKI